MPEGVEHHGVTSSSCSPCVSQSSFKDHSYQSSPGRMKQLFCLLNPPPHKKKNQDSQGKILLLCLTNISYHEIFSFSRIRSRDVLINISDGNQTFAILLLLLTPRFFVPHTVSQVLTYAEISSMGQWADNRMHRRLCQKSSGLICTSYQITM